MNFEEHAAKSLVLAPAAIPVLRAVLCLSAKEAAMAAAQIGPCVVKAQVPMGKRGKAGGIKLANTPVEAEQVAAQILGMRIGDYTVERLLVEQQAKIVREFYAAVLCDTTLRKPLILFSTEGGMDIEEIAAEKPKAIRRLAGGSSSASRRRSPRCPCRLRWRTGSAACAASCRAAPRHRIRERSWPAARPAGARRCSRLCACRGFAPPLARLPSAYWQA